jgi:small redox-active disulfide protein 2
MSRRRFQRHSLPPNHALFQDLFLGEIGMSTEVKVLGIGCSNCKRLYSEAQKAILQAGVPATLSKVETIEEIAAYKILATPALVIDGEVKSAGRIPDVSEITTWLATAAMEQPQR